MPRDQFEQVLLLIHQAALDDSLWPRAARLINEVTQAKGHMLCFGRGSERRSVEEVSFARMFFGSDRFRDLEEEYARVYWRRDEAFPRLKQLPKATIRSFPDL